MRCRSGARQRALHLFETFKAHASVIPLAGLCLAGERRIGDPSPRSAVRRDAFCSSGIIAEAISFASAMNPRRRLSEFGGTGERIMPSYGPELIQTMRTVLDEVMTKIPVEQVTPGIKAHMAEFILKAVAEGQTSYDGLLASASSQIETIVSMLS
jgi:hypothetical protein